MMMWCTSMKRNDDRRTQDRVCISLPPKELSPNARPHYMAKARAVRRYRAAAWAAALEILGTRRPRLQHARISIQFVFKRADRRDIDNLLASIKPAIDGLVAAGMLADDSSAHVSYGDIGVSVGENQGVTLIVEELEESNVHERNRGCAISGG